MLFIWGAQRQRRTAAKPEVCYCPNCSRDESCTVVLTYTVRHFWFLMRWTTGKAYHAVCDACNTVAGRLNTKTYEAKIKKNPVPVFDRFGWLITLGAISALVPVGAVYAGFDEKNDIALLNSPRAGDIYELHSETSGNSSCADCNYGTALVSSVDANNVNVRLSKKIYNRLTALNDFATGPSAKSPDEYLEETYAIPRQKLVAMRKDGAMVDAIR